ncbi:MAG: fatty acid desaturase [Pseudomonadota bacterium]
METFLIQGTRLLGGLVHMPLWAYAVAALVLTHITIASVTIFLHRNQAHRAVELHPIMSHFFRFWLWMTTGMVTQEWVSVHRKHHAFCERKGDPHSPQIYGIEKVLWQGVELYKVEANNPETIKRFGHATPDDWFERNVYKPYSKTGIVFMCMIDLLVFGPLGLSIWAVQMIWIPLFAAGIVNGIGHYWGYRNYEVNDTSTNISPWGILIGGEELHNNHHAFPASAKLSAKWYELDIGWLYICLLEWVGLAKVKKVIPEYALDFSKTVPDHSSLEAITLHRYAVLIEYGKMMWKLGRSEIKKVQRTHTELTNRSGRQWWKLLRKDKSSLSVIERDELQQLLQTSVLLHTLYEFYEGLQDLWGRSESSSEDLTMQLQAWCVRAQSSGIVALADFSRYLTRFA